MNFRIYLKLIFLCVFIESQAFAQDFPIDSSTNTITYSEVIKVNEDASVLYLRGRTYFAINYKSANEVIQLDLENTKIIGKAFKDIYYDYGIPRLGFNKTKLKLYFTLEISFKDGKYRYILNNLYTESYPTSQYPIAQKFTLEEIFITNPNKPKSKKRIMVREGMVKNTQDAIEEIINNLKKSIQISNGELKDDW